MEQGRIVVAQPDPVRRTSEIEEPTNLYVIHPASAWLTRRFARLGVSPNAVSLAGMAAGLLAGVAYHAGFLHGCDPRAVLVGFMLMVVWHVMDGADGQLARLTGRYSQTGKILDGVCDYATFAAVYVGLALSLAPRHGGWVWALVAVAGFCHAVQSAAYERQRQDYNFWGWGRGASPLARNVVPSGRRAGDVLFGLYARIEALTTALGESGLNGRLAVMLAAHPDRAPDIRQRYRAAFALQVRRWSVLSANYRTLGLFLCALPGRPLAYFAFEIVGFSVILLGLLRRQRRCDARFLAALEGVAAEAPPARPAPARALSVNVR
ncbi:CDP-alcohol phosphatidyltransferase family protein [Nguyenibacter vanlangensis]|uniref:CDP-alcohol phosphatidyltransferase family protein n=1 Tax=Nguyenibacter vanlangensis TaxID=1216886 RepID=A0A7Y7IVD8_9PROT|nr:CDP-alcohol phosphatidyltransferase family protein [Nguyenibacter vanlangensis]